MLMYLRDLAQARSGDKGNVSDIALFAITRDVYDLLKREVTAERVKEHFKGICFGEVERFEVPNVLALKFVLHEALGGGGPSSIRIDNLGKSLSAALLRMQIEVPEPLSSSIQKKWPPASLSEITTW
jgi:hypothetical protein